MKIIAKTLNTEFRVGIKSEINSKIIYFENNLLLTKINVLKNEKKKFHKHIFYIRNSIIGTGHFNDHYFERALFWINLIY